MWGERGRRRKIDLGQRCGVEGVSAALKKETICIRMQASEEVMELALEGLLLVLIYLSMNWLGPGV